METTLQTIETMTRQDLVVVYRRLRRYPPPDAFDTSLLRSVVAHLLQERLFGGLSALAEKSLAAIARRVERDRDRNDGEPVPKSSSPSRRIKPGSRLVRSWQGTVHEVIVTADGFRWNAMSFASLSAVAKAITGTSWNGWTFFGVERPRHPPRTDGGSFRNGLAARGDLAQTEITP